MDLHELKQQVLSNCDVTDAQHAGIYSVCGLVMRLRDLYKWEHRLLPWQDDAPAKVLDWIGEKETLWETLMDAPYRPIDLDGRHYEAFDTTAINERLRPHRLFYGAGYAHSLKPTFFLADIERVTQVSGHTVITTGTEYARDLLTLPAFSQEGGVVLRLEAARMFLWDHILYLGRSGRSALHYAARACGLPDAGNDTLRHGFDNFWPAQEAIYVQHEIGELEETVFDRATWQQMLADYPHTAVELLVRTLKDLLADTGPHGALTDLIDRRDNTGLGLYMAFGNGITRILTTALRCAFDAFIADSRWERMAEAAGKMRLDVAAYAGEVMTLYQAAQARKDIDSGRDAIERTMADRGLLSKPPV